MLVKGLEWNDLQVLVQLLSWQGQCHCCQALTELTLKSLSTTPTMKLFLVSYERYGQINTFLLWYYGTNFASIKRYDQFCLFTVVYKEAQIHPLLTLFILFSCSSFCSHCLPSSPSLCLLSACSPSLCLLSLFFHFFLYILFPLISTLYPFSALSFSVSILYNWTLSLLSTLFMLSFFLSASCFGILLFP